jgi:hypothetical protein
MMHRLLLAPLALAAAPLWAATAHATRNDPPDAAIATWSAMVAAPTSDTWLLLIGGLGLVVGLVRARRPYRLARSDY